MGKIVSFPDKNAEATMEGPARCARCNYEWHAVTPVGRSSGLECSSCGSFHGFMVFPCSPPEGELLYVCDCGSNVLSCALGSKSWKTRWIRFCRRWPQSHVRGRRARLSED